MTQPVSSCTRKQHLGPDPRRNLNFRLPILLAICALMRFGSGRFEIARREDRLGVSASPRKCPFSPAPDPKKNQLATLFRPTYVAPVCPVPHVKWQPRAPMPSFFSNPKVRAPMSEKTLPAGQVGNQRPAPENASFAMPFFLQRARTVPALGVGQPRSAFPACQPARILFFIIFFIFFIFPLFDPPRGGARRWGCAARLGHVRPAPRSQHRRPALAWRPPSPAAAIFTPTHPAAPGLFFQKLPLARRRAACTTTAFPAANRPEPKPIRLALTPTLRAHAESNPKRRPAKAPPGPP